LGDFGYLDEQIGIGVVLLLRGDAATNRDGVSVLWVPCINYYTHSKWVIM